MKTPTPVIVRSVAAWILLGLTLSSTAASFDAAPFGFRHPEGNGVFWEDPREIHRVIVHFTEPPSSPDPLHLEYWGSWWPERHLPKDREPGGGDIGWMELGNWWKNDWRVADTVTEITGKTVTFTFRPVNAAEFPNLADYAAIFRYTLKLRVTSDSPLPAIERLEALTDSTLEPRGFHLVTDQSPAPTVIEVFNGHFRPADPARPDPTHFLIDATVNPDPNTFDRTIVTVAHDTNRFSFRVDDLAQGPLWLPHWRVAVLADGDPRSYTAVAAAQQARGEKTLYDRVSEQPEQTWSAAWDGVPPKKSRIYFPMGLDGGRQRFRLNADGSIEFRTNDGYLRGLAGKDTPRLDLEAAPVSFRFDLPGTPVHRTLEEESLPICITTWQVNDFAVRQTAFVTRLDGFKAEDPVPPADAFAVWMAEFTITNTGRVTQTATLPLHYRSRDTSPELRLDPEGALWVGDQVRGQVSVPDSINRGTNPVAFQMKLQPGESRSFILKLPYVVLDQPAERKALKRLRFAPEHQAVAGYWRRRLDAGARLLTPEPMLNEFYRSQAMHLLVNCEREPNSDRRFARVGSFGYGAYGNESCMMVLDLERRGLHETAQECLDGWLHYQGTAALPGSFADHDGVLYGAAGYEAGGYNQHHGWILWMLAEHYRFTRDDAWLRQSAPGLVKGADWVIRETARTQDRHELEQGLLPAGSLEDIGDWWTWLSTSCYTWRGLDNAAWALEQIQHPDAPRIRSAATDYHAALLTNFRKASERSPVVRLRDGTAVPQFPSHVHRRGRSFGWICQTLEGALHLLITRAVDPHSIEAEWILKDYEDNLYLSNQYGYTLDNFEEHWFSRGGMSMQACLLLDVEPYLYRDDVKHALRALFNGQAVSYFPDVRLNTEHALPALGDWRGDHFKSSDESNATGWLRYLFVREEGEDTLLIGQAIPRDWLRGGQRCGLERTATWFGPTSVLYEGGSETLTCQLEGPTRNPPKEIRLRFRHPEHKPFSRVTVDGKSWNQVQEDWVLLPGTIGKATITAHYQP